MVTVNSEILPSNVAPNTPMNTEIFLSGEPKQLEANKIRVSFYASDLIRITKDASDDLLCKDSVCFNNTTINGSNSFSQFGDRVPITDLT